MPRTKYPTFPLTSTRDGAAQILTAADFETLCMKIWKDRKNFTNRKPRFVDFNEIGLNPNRAYIAQAGTGREINHYSWFRMTNGLEVYIEQRSTWGRISLRKSS